MGVVDTEYHMLLHDIFYQPKSNYLEAHKPSYVYFLFDGEFVKIGVANEIISRIASIQTGNARTIKLLGFIRFETKQCAYYAEKKLHKFWDIDRINGEWFDIEDDERFVALLNSNHINKRGYTNPNTGDYIPCFNFNIEEENKADITDAVEKLRNFFGYYEKAAARECQNA